MERRYGYSSNCAPQLNSADLEQLCIEDGATVVDLRLDRAQAWESDAEIWDQSPVDVAFVSGACPSAAPPGLRTGPFRLVASQASWTDRAAAVHASVNNIRSHGVAVYLETHWEEGSSALFAQAVAVLQVGIVADSFGLWRMLGTRSLRDEPELVASLSERTTALQLKGIAADRNGWKHVPLDHADGDYLHFVADLLQLVPHEAPVLIETKANSHRCDVRAAQRLEQGSTS